MGTRVLVVASFVLAACAPGVEGELDSGRALPRSELHPGAIVDLAGVAVGAPEVGSGVFAEVLFEDGTSKSLVLQTGLDGRVFEVLPFEHHGGDESDDADEQGGVSAEAVGEKSNPNAVGPCLDKSYALLPHHVPGALTWYFNAGSTPAGNSVSAIEGALKRAANNIAASKNSCAMADQVSATHTYAGKTSQPGQLSNDGQCTAMNGVNSVGFGTLPKGVLGVACSFYDGSGAVVEADIRLNKAYKWYGDKPSNCSGRYSVEAVATHEFGHVFGLGHVDEAKHGNLTMSTAMNGTCQNTEATLGRGDVLGLRAKY